MRANTRICQLLLAGPYAPRGFDDTPRIVAFRNILAHGYDAIDHQIVWHLIREEPPGLLQGVEALLAETDSA